MVTYSKDQLIELICTHCDFYKESERDLECGAFKILRALLEEGRISADDVGRAFPRS